ncbi:MAG: hypothetical protein ACK4FB_10150 [Brevundimonas sp.]|uniref:hypothetical protein n=1 Tax=Brevundimonas sp. TaxID=1871086 RepID=UPI00391D578F
MYPSQFDTPAAAYPASSDLLLSVPPVILLLFLLLLLLALLCGWYAREQMGPKQKDSCEAIYDDVRKAAEAALKASRDEVHARARGLLAVMDRRLGGVLALADGASGPCASIREVLDGKPEKPEPCHGPEHDETGGAHAAELVVVNTGKLVVHAGGGGEAGKGCEAGHGDRPDAGAPAKAQPARPAPDRRAEIERLRAAVHAFADHWRDRETRLRELRRARANLC